MKLATLSLICLILNSNVYSFEIPKICDEINNKNKDCVSCTMNKVSSSEFSELEKLNDQLNFPDKQYKVFASKAHELKEANNVLKDKLASLFRSLRDGKSEPTYVNATKEINLIEEDFNRLTILSKEAQNLEKRFQICLTNCSPIRRLELLDEIKKVQNLKISLLIGQPILANKSFEKLISEMSDEMSSSDDFFPKKVFEDKLKDALFDNLQIILKKRDQFDHFENDPEKPDFKKSNKQSLADYKQYNSELVKHYPLIAEDIVREFSTNEITKDSDKLIACQYIKDFKSMTTKKEYQELALDVGLFALPFALGPVGRLGSFSAEFFLGEKLAVWGLKSENVSSTIKISDLTFQAALAGNEVNSIFNKYNQCKEVELNFLSNANADKLKTLNECKKELSNKIFLSELASLSMASSTLAPRALSLLKSMTIPSVKTPKTVSLLLKDFGDGKNKIIKTEIESMISSSKKEKELFSNLSSVPTEKNSVVKSFIQENHLENTPKLPTIIPDEKLIDFQSKIAKDTIELLYIPGSEIPFLPNSVNKVGHIAIRIGNNVYHQTGGSGFKIETFENFLHQTKKNYKVFGQVMKVSQKEQAIMENYFKKMYDKQLPYSFLVNNCSQAVCRAMSIADFKNAKPLASHDPIATLIQLKRNDRVVMSTLYNADKDLTVEQLKRATLNNRLAFYGVPALATASAVTGAYQAVDFVIEYLEQIKESDITK